MSGNSGRVSIQNDGKWPKKFHIGLDAGCPFYTIHIGGLAFQIQTETIGDSYDSPRYANPGSIDWVEDQAHFDKILKHAGDLVVRTYGGNIGEAKKATQLLVAKALRAGNAQEAEFYYEQFKNAGGNAVKRCELYHRGAVRYRPARHGDSFEDHPAMNWVYMRQVEEATNFESLVSFAGLKREELPAPKPIPEAPEDEDDARTQQDHGDKRKRGKRVNAPVVS